MLTIMYIVYAKKDIISRKQFDMLDGGYN